jgi:aflatoxin B1 aldehyde reductase
LAANLEKDSEPDGRFHPQTTQGQKYRERYWKSQYFEAVTLYKKACEDFSLSPICVALSWLNFHSLLKPSSDGIIIGASSLKHAKENLQTLVSGSPLPDGLLDRLEECWVRVQSVCPTYFR